MTVFISLQLILRGCIVSCLGRLVHYLGKRRLSVRAAKDPLNGPSLRCLPGITIERHEILKPVKHSLYYPVQPILFWLVAFLPFLAPPRKSACYIIRAVQCVQ